MSEERKPTPCRLENSGMIACENCIELFITETQQDEMYKNTGKRPFHLCLKYGKTLVHGNKHPLLYPCIDCLADQTVFIALQAENDSLTAEVERLREHAIEFGNQLCKLWEASDSSLYTDDFDVKAVIEMCVKFNKFIKAVHGFSEND